MSTVGTPGALPKIPTSASFLGQGVAYPLTYDPNTGRLKLSAGNQSVIDSMSSIFQTQPGERVMQPDYGCDVSTFEPIAVGKLQAKAQEVVAAHEPRVTNVNIDVGDQFNVNELNAVVTFEVTGSATPQTLTFPFFTGP